MSHPFSSILDLCYFCRMELNFMWKLGMLLVQCLWSKSRKCTVTQSSFWFTATNFKQISNENKIMKFPRNKLIWYSISRKLSKIFHHKKRLWLEFILSRKPEFCDNSANISLTSGQLQLWNWQKPFCKFHPLYWIPLKYGENDIFSAELDLDEHDDGILVILRQN